MTGQVQPIKNSNNDSHKQQLRQKEDKTTFYLKIPLKRQIGSFTQLIKLCFTTGYSWFIKEAEKASI